MDSTNKIDEYLKINLNKNDIIPNKIDYFLDTLLEKKNDNLEEDHSDKVIGLMTEIIEVIKAKPLVEDDDASDKIIGLTEAIVQQIKAVPPVIVKPVIKDDDASYKIVNLAKAIVEQIKEEKINKVQAIHAAPISFGTETKQEDNKTTIPKDDSRCLTAFVNKFQPQINEGFINPKDVKPVVESEKHCILVNKERDETYKVELEPLATIAPVNADAAIVSIVKAVPIS